jgi:hypothetical protein
MEGASMSWRQDTIVHCKEAISRLRHGIEQMHAGTFEVRELDHGRWVLVARCLRLMICHDGGIRGPSTESTMPGEIPG